MHSVNNLFESFKKNGYTTFIIPKGLRGKVLFTKATLDESLFNEPFEDDTQFDEFTLEDEFEKSVFKVFPRNTFIKLGD